MLMQARPEKWGRYVTEGTWDEEVVEEIAPQPGDVVVRKQRYSGFAGTNLDMILKTHGIRYCLYTGVATNVCVETTLRDGYLLDYWPHPGGRRLQQLGAGIQPAGHGMERGARVRLGDHHGRMSWRR